MEHQSVEHNYTRPLPSAREPTERYVARFYKYTEGILTVA